MMAAMTRSHNPFGTLSVLAAPLLVAAALFAPSWPGGVPIAPLERWMIGVFAAAFLVLGYSIRRDAAGFGALAFAFLTGAAAQLYMTEPLWFPTLRLKPQTLTDWVMVAILVTEAVVVASALVRAGWRPLLAAAAQRLGAGRVVLFLAFTFAFVVPVLHYVGRDAAGAYVAHVLAGAALILLHIAALVSMTRTRSPISAAHRLTPIAPATIAVVASLLLGVFAFEGIPHVEDEVGYLFQAQTFAGGALTAPAPPEAAQPALDYYLIEVRDGHWYSATLPGWPAALALGIATGLGWLLNPLLAGVSVMLAYAITLRKAGQDTADVVALMMAASPWLLAAAGSMMPHTLTLTLSLFAWWMILVADERGGGRWHWRLVAGGLAMGWIFAARPLDGVLVGALTGLWLLFARAGGLWRALPYAAGCVAAGGLLLVYNAAITGSALTLPLSDYLDRHWLPGANDFGFGPDIGPPEGWGALDLWPGHSAGEALLNTINLVSSLQFEMMGWPVGSLALFLAFLLWGRRLTGFDMAMMAMISVVVVTMAFYWFAESYYFGPRYWFLAAFPFFYLSARGCLALRELLPESGPGHVRNEAILWILCLFGLLVFTPWRGLAKYHEYGNYYDDIRDAAATGQFGDDIVLMTKSGNEGSGFILNDPWLRSGRPVFLLDTGALDLDALRAAFPGREIRSYDPGWEPRVPRERRSGESISRTSNP